MYRRNRMKSRLMLAILLLASIAAYSQPLSINYRLFPGGEFLPPFSLFHATPGQNIILGAPKEIQVQDPSGNLKTYIFRLWLVPSGPVNSNWFGTGGPTTNAEAVFKAPVGGAHASAWYQQ